MIETNTLKGWHNISLGCIETEPGVEDTHSNSRRIERLVW